MSKRLEKLKEKYSKANVIEHINGIDIIAVDKKDLDYFIEQVERVESLIELNLNTEWQMEQQININHQISKDKKRYRESINNIKQTWKKADNIYNHVEMIHEIIMELEGDPHG